MGTGEFVAERVMGKQLYFLIALLCCFFAIVLAVHQFGYGFPHFKSGIALVLVMIAYWILAVQTEALIYYVFKLLVYRRPLIPQFLWVVVLSTIICLYPIQGFINEIECYHVTFPVLNWHDKLLKYSGIMLVLGITLAVDWKLLRNVIFGDLKRYQKSVIVLFNVFYAVGLIYVALYFLVRSRIGC